MKFKNKVGSFVVLTRKNRSEVFLVLRSDFPVWEPQGGAIEDEETPEQCAIRETYEETGFKIKIVKKIAEYTYLKTKTIESHVFEGKYLSGKYKKEYPECKGKWFNVKKLPKNMMAIRKMMICDCINNKNELITKNSISLFSIKNLHLLFLLPKQSIYYIIRKSLPNLFPMFYY